MNDKKQPQGTLATQTIAMPADTNSNGDIFGGWLLSQMDLAGAVMAKRTAKGRITTIAIDSMVFHKPVKVGDVVSCYADLIKIGKTSMTIKVEAWTIRSATGEANSEATSEESEDLQHVTEGIFTYVAINDKGKPRAVKPFKERKL